MKNLNLESTELPKELEGFAGGMGYLSIASITEHELGFDIKLDVKAYISEPVDGVYYAEVMDGDGNSEYASGEIDDMQKWAHDKVYEYCKNLSEH